MNTLEKVHLRIMKKNKPAESQLLQTRPGRQTYLIE
mgnify:CR=1 FL=1